MKISDKKTCKSDEIKVLYSIAQQNRIPWVKLIEGKEDFSIDIDDHVLLIYLENNIKEIKDKNLNKIHWKQANSKIKKQSYKNLCIELCNVIYKLMDNQSFITKNNKLLTLDYNLISKKQLIEIQLKDKNLHILDIIKNYKDAYHEIIKKYLNISRNAKENCLKVDKKSIVKLNNRSNDIFKCDGRLLSYRMMSFECFKKLILEIINDDDIDDFTLLLNRNQNLKKELINLKVKNIKLHKSFQNDLINFSKCFNKELIISDARDEIEKYSKVMDKLSSNIKAIELNYLEKFDKSIINNSKKIGELSNEYLKIEQIMKDMNETKREFDVTISNLSEKFTIFNEKLETNKNNNDFKLINMEKNLDAKIGNYTEYYQKNLGNINKKIEEYFNDNNIEKNILSEKIKNQDILSDKIEKKMITFIHDIELVNEKLEFIKNHVEIKYEDSIKFINNRFNSIDTDDNIRKKIEKISSENHQMKELIQEKEMAIQKIEKVVDELLEREKKISNIPETMEVTKLKKEEYINKDYVQEIYSGAPGTGKSYALKKRMQKNDYEFIRITFHPEYEYHNFVGSIVPFTENNNVLYKYNGGPFVDILKDALLNPNKSYALIIEEMTRANCSAVFGDIFQLLDRDSDGWSMYHIVNWEIYNELNIQVEETIIDGRIKIPPNLSIFGTLNTSDQSTFSLDTAFKRRFSIKHMDANRSDEDKKKVKFNNEIILWESFYKEFNKYITKELNLNEDKQIGPYFINQKEATDGTGLEKVLIYIYHEVFNIYFRYDKDNQIFLGKASDLKTILDKYETSQIFNDTLNGRILGK